MRQTACARRVPTCYHRRGHLGGSPHARHEAACPRLDEYRVAKRLFQHAQVQLMHQFSVTLVILSHECR